ncbi:hypothetical protein [Halorientalis pallida]|uniref:Uncharacterized protein n=1 Tax=Halorientalis pallida TaxID=2479928 RepID=A0A498KZW7_9EURY|nr:hypothetical protein [Halorientalis pallida]RXK51580.1 hypothetical protein EAF64_02825 [Halorientalis pallida]
MSRLSRRRFGLAVLSVLSAGCVSERSPRESETGEASVAPQADRQPTATADGTTDTVAEPEIRTETTTDGPEARFTVGDRQRRSRTTGGQFLLDENSYENFDVVLESTADITYDMIVRRGPPVDVLVFTPEEFGAFQRRHRARHLAEVSTFHTTNVANKTVTVPPGEYRIVVNNTDWPRAVPSGGEQYSQLEDDVLVDFEVEWEPIDTPE